MLTANNLSFSIDGHLVLEKICCSFAPAEIAVITGPNGSGKTMLLQILAGLLKPDTGELLLDGEVYPQKHTRLGTGVGLMFQQPELQIIEQTVEQDILFGLKNLELPKDEQKNILTDALSWSGLEERREQDPHSLSGGEKRRLALAGIIAMSPRFVLLDEPFENLDYPGVMETLRQILTLKKRGCGVIIVTHGLEKCLAHVDRLVLLKGGRIMADALPERVILFLEDHGVRKPSAKIRDMTWLKD